MFLFTKSMFRNSGDSEFRGRGSGIRNSRPDQPRPTLPQPTLPRPRPTLPHTAPPRPAPLRRGPPHPDPPRLPRSQLNISFFFPEIKNGARNFRGFRIPFFITTTKKSEFGISGNSEFRFVSHQQKRNSEFPEIPNSDCACQRKKKRNSAFPDNSEFRFFGYFRIPNSGNSESRERN